MSIWPPPPDLASIKELVRDADPEGSSPKELLPTNTITKPKQFYRSDRVTSLQQTY